MTGMFEIRGFGSKKKGGADTVFENPTYNDSPVITKLDGNTKPITKSAITRITSETGLLSWLPKTFVYLWFMLPTVYTYHDNVYIHHYIMYMYICEMNYIFKNII